MPHYKKKEIKNDTLRERLESLEPYKFQMVALRDFDCDENAREIVDCLTELVQENKPQLSMGLTAQLINDRYNHPEFRRFVAHQLTKQFLPEGDGRKFQGITVKQMRAVREAYELYILHDEVGEYGHLGKIKDLVANRYAMDVSSLTRKMKEARPTITAEYHDKIGKLLPNCEKQKT